MKLLEELEHAGLQSGRHATSAAPDAGDAGDGFLADPMLGFISRRGVQVRVEGHRRPVEKLQPQDIGIHSSRDRADGKGVSHQVEIQVPALRSRPHPVAGPRPQRIDELQTAADNSAVEDIRAEIAVHREDVIPVGHARNAARELTGQSRPAEGFGQQLHVDGLQVRIEIQLGIRAESKLLHCSTMVKRPVTLQIWRISAGSPQASCF